MHHYFKRWAPLKVEALVNTPPDTLSEVVKKGNCAYTNLCGGRGTGSTEADTRAGVEAYMCLDPLNEVEAEALVYTQAHTFAQV